MQSLVRPRPMSNQVSDEVLVTGASPTAQVWVALIPLSWMSASTPSTNGVPMVASYSQFDHRQTARSERLMTATGAAAIVAARLQRRRRAATDTCVCFSVLRSASIDGAQSRLRVDAGEKVDFLAGVLLLGALIRLIWSGSRICGLNSSATSTRTHLR